MSNIFNKILKKLGIVKDKKSSNNLPNSENKTITENKNLKNISDDNFTSNYKNKATIDSNNSDNDFAEINQILKQNQITRSQMLSLNQNEKISESSKIYDVQKISKTKINTIWDILKIKENTQAEHILNSLPDDHWIDMEELKQRIKLQYNIEYQNEKSLYPYIKTLTDINLIKLNNAGKKRTWKKNIILIEKD